MKKQAQFTVGFLLYEGCTLMDFAGAIQVFASGPGQFEVITIAKNKKVTTTEKLSVLADYDLTNSPKIDLLFIPGGGNEGVVSAMQNLDIIEFIQKTSQNAQWRGSVCTGAFILAAAGLLVNTEATTYWSVLPALRKLEEKYKIKVPEGFPRYLVNTISKLFTGGGISSSVDLALELVTQIRDKETAMECQLMIQYQPDPPQNAGDPAHAPISVTAKVAKMEEGFIKAMNQAAESLL